MFATADVSLALAAIPTSIAAIVVGWLTYKGTRAAVPAVQTAAAIEPRLSAAEDTLAGWKAALAAKDEIIANLRAELELCRSGHPPGGS